MTRLRFAMLNAAQDGGHTRRNFIREFATDLVEFDANAGHLPDHTDFDAIIVTGSRSSVYWEDAWIDSLIDYVATAVADDVPALGVCFGHQVLAAALGGRVDDMGAFEIGYNTVSHDGSDPLFTDIDESFSVFTTHGDAVVELPPDADLLAENEYGVHAFRVGDAWGVQFHPEYDLETARHVTGGKRDRIGDDRADAVLESITPDQYTAACEAKPIFDNFETYVRDRQQTHAVEPMTAD